MLRSSITLEQVTFTKSVDICGEGRNHDVSSLPWLGLIYLIARVNVICLLLMKFSDFHENH